MGPIGPGSDKRLTREGVRMAVDEYLKELGFMPKKPELRPCPFCGSHDARLIREDGTGQGYVNCDECDTDSGWADIDTAIEAWNERA